MTPAGFDPDHPQHVELHISPPDPNGVYVVALLIGGSEVARERANESGLTATISKMLTMAALRIRGAALWSKVWPPGKRQG